VLEGIRFGDLRAINGEWQLAVGDGLSLASWYRGRVIISAMHGRLEAWRLLASNFGSAVIVGMVSARGFAQVVSDRFVSAQDG
jgi:hypothetical protein